MTSAPDDKLYKKCLIYSGIFFSLCFAACNVTNESKKTTLLRYDTAYVLDNLDWYHSGDLSGDMCAIIKFKPDGTVLYAEMVKPESGNYDFFTREWCKDKVGRFPVFIGKYKFSGEKFSFTTSGAHYYHIDGIVKENELVVNKIFDSRPKHPFTLNSVKFVAQKP